MERLWRRQITLTDICYVDIFDSIQTNDVFFQHFLISRSEVPYKNNTLSAGYRELGDDAFDGHRYNEALNFYSRSLCFAQIGTEFVGWAYAKRSFSLYYLGRYMEALSCIKNALSTSVPDRLLPELEQYARNCHEYRNREQQQLVIMQTLDYDSSERFPGLANVVKLNYNAQFGRHFVANRDIPQGRVILADVAFAVNHLNCLNVCSTCFVTLKNYVPCENCAYAVFCSRQCMTGNKTHQYVCGTFFGYLHESVYFDIRIEWIGIKLIIQTVLNALSTFPSVDSLMEYIRIILNEDIFILPSSTVDAVSKYHFFFKLKRFIGNDVLIIAKHAYLLAMELPKIREHFHTLEKQFFLMHLIAHHTSAYYPNSVRTADSIVVSNLHSLFNHSCVPNAQFTVAQNLVSVETLQPIKSGEQIYISYIPGEQLLADRVQSLLRVWEFECNCDKCRSERQL